MAESCSNSPARGASEQANCEPQTDAEERSQIDEEVAAGQDLTVVDGWLKFRDNKRWKPRWGVVSKLSPAADCLHLQLYRDSKDRYKQGHTKASLSLQHFLAIETGFTLDKESNTIAIICQDVTVILAFDTRERLMQWQVKIANNLGEDMQFLIQMTSAPPRAKIAAGQARLHVMEQRFCLTSGVPPRLLGFWDISQLRRYGVVEGRFVFEGGSRCGKGEGVHVCVTDQGEEITKAFQMAAQGKIVARRAVTRNTPATDSPRRRGVPYVMDPDQTPSSAVRAEEMSSGIDSYNISCIHSAQESFPENCMDQVCHDQSENNVSVMHDNPGLSFHSHKCNEISKMEEMPTACRSCIDHWCSSSHTLRHHILPSHTSSLPRPHNRNKCLKNCKIFSVETKPILNRSVHFENACTEHLTSQKKEMSEVCIETSGSTLYDTPDSFLHPSDLQETSQQNPELKFLPNDKCDKTGASYDVPKNVQKTINSTLKLRTASYEDIYDIIPHSQSSLPHCGCVLRVCRKKELWNALRTKQHMEYKESATETSLMNCPCQRVMCWAGNLMSLPYCRRGNGIEDTGNSTNYIKENSKMPSEELCEQMTVSATEEKLQKCCKNGDSQVVYATIDKSNKTNKKIISHATCSCTIAACNCKNSTPNFLCQQIKEKCTGAVSSNLQYNSSNIKSALNEMSPEEITTFSKEDRHYENISFAESLEHYENVKDILKKAVIDEDRAKNLSSGNIQFQKNIRLLDSASATTLDTVRICNKCGHEFQMNNSLFKNTGAKCKTINSSLDDRSYQRKDDYIMMQPVEGTICNSDDNDLVSPAARKAESYLTMSPAQSSNNSLIDDYKPSIPSQSSMFHKIPKIFFNAAQEPDIEPFKTDEDVCRQMPNLDLKETDTIKRAKRFDTIPSYTIKNEICKDMSHHASNLSTDTDMPSQNYISYFNVSKLEQEELNCGNTVQEHTNCSTSLMDYTISMEDLIYDCGKCTKFDKTNSENSLQPVQRRRSSSVPCKTGANRDSSSSNDSGVSVDIVMLRQKQAVNLETSTTFLGSIQCNTMGLPLYNKKCLHSSLPRRSSSIEPLGNLAQSFQKSIIPAKSSSMDARETTCPKTSVSGSPEGENSVAIPYMDSQSVSSGTSNISDYMDTLSLCSHSSTEIQEGRLGRQAATTLRPRSGKEYQLIDRYILEGDIELTG